MKRWHAYILVLAVGGCAASVGDVEEDSLGAAERVCVSVRNIHSFDDIDDRHILVTANPRKQQFLFTLSGGCFGIRSAHTIAIRDTFNRVCSNSFGEVAYREMGRGLEFCRILNIEPVVSKDDARGLIKDRKAEKQEKQAEKKSNSSP